MSEQEQVVTVEPGKGDGPVKPLTGREAASEPFVQAQRESGGERGREMLAHAAQGAELTAEEEVAGLDWLLGVPRKIVHEIPVQYETPDGMTTLKFMVPRHDTKRLDSIEQRHINPNTGRLDRIGADIEIVAALASEIVDAKGRRTLLRSDEFLTVPLLMPNGDREMTKTEPPIALEKRFADQLGLVMGVSTEIRRINGFDADRIGQAQRRLVDAALG